MYNSPFARKFPALFETIYEDELLEYDRKARPILSPAHELVVEVPLRFVDTLWGRVFGHPWDSLMRDFEAQQARLKSVK